MKIVNKRVWFIEAEGNDRVELKKDLQRKVNQLVIDFERYVDRVEILNKALRVNNNHHITGQTQYVATYEIQITFFTNEFLEEDLF